MQLRGPDLTDVKREWRSTVALALLFAGIALLAAVDLLADIGQGTGLRHLLIEGGLVITGLAGLAATLRHTLSIRREARELRLEAKDLTRRLEVTEADARAWRKEAQSLLHGLGAEIDRQFVRWELSPAEKEVALLLLKGLSHKEIASARSIGEATARQQARAVYRKGGLTGRHDLAAFFLEDLLLPAESRDAPAP